jgi:hypothetical protein
VKYVEFDIPEAPKGHEEPVTASDIVKAIVRRSGWREETQVRELAEIVGLIADAAGVDVSLVLAEKLKEHKLNVKRKEE